MALLSRGAIILDEISRNGSIRRTAERINASPSAVNRQLINLEIEIGAALFERLPKGVRLTTAGEAVVREVRRWRHDQERLVKHLQELKGLRRGHVVAGIMECFSDTLAPNVFNNLQHKHPRVTLEAFVGGTDAVLARLGEGGLDVAIAFNLSKRPEFAITYSRLIPIGAVMAPSHPLAKAKSVRLTNCLDYPFVMPDQSLSFRGPIDRAIGRRSDTIIAAITANSISFMKNAVRDGQRITLLTLLDVVNELESGALVFHPLGDEDIRPDTLSIAVANKGRDSSLSALVASAMQEEADRILAKFPALSRETQRKTLRNRT